MATLGSRGIVKSEQELIKDIDAIEALTKAIAKSGASFLKARNTTLINKDAKSVASNSLISLFNTESGLEKKARLSSDIRRAYGLVGAGKFSNVGDAYSSIIQRRGTRKAQAEAASDYFSSRSPSNWMSRFTKQFGAAGRTVAQMEYGDAMLAITDPDKLHKEELKREWGDVRGEALYKAERHQKASGIAKKRRSEARKSAIAADQAFKYDMMSDYEQQMHDLTKRYGGDKAKADAKIRNDALKKMPKFMVDMLKNSKISTKSLVSISKNPLVTKFAKHPVAAPLAIAGAAAHFGQKILNDISKSNQEMTSLQNVVNLYGKPSDKFSEAAVSAGIKDPAKISKLWGTLNLKYGSFDRFASAIGSKYGSADYRSRILMAQQEGWDEDTVALLDYLSKSGRMSGKARQLTATKNKLDFAITAAESSDASLLTWMSTWKYKIPFLKDFDIRWNPDRISRMYSDALNESVYDAVKSADDYQKAPRTKTEETLRTAEKAIQNPVFQISELVIPGLSHVDQLVTALLDMAQSKSDNEATLKSFDTGRK